MNHLARGHHDHRHPFTSLSAACRAHRIFDRQRIVNVIAEQLRRTIAPDIRVVHYSIQGDHLHLLVEAADATRRNGLAGSFRDRHFRQTLETPPQVRRALVYIVMNGRKHRAQQGRSSIRPAIRTAEEANAGFIDRWQAAAHSASEIEIGAAPASRLSSCLEMQAS